jgi:hypothetical protein
MEVLVRIKRLAFARRIILTRKAELEMDMDGLTEDEVIDAEAYACPFHNLPNLR